MTFHGFAYRGKFSVARPNVLSGWGFVSAGENGDAFGMHALASSLRRVSGREARCSGGSAGGSAVLTGSRHHRRDRTRHDQQVGRDPLTTGCGRPAWDRRCAVGLVMARPEGLSASWRGAKWPEVARPTLVPLAAPGPFSALRRGIAARFGPAFEPSGGAYDSVLAAGYLRAR